jgi:hypothetical protein
MEIRFSIFTISFKKNIYLKLNYKDKKIRFKGIP